MEFYTKEQVDQMLSNAIDQTMGFAENGGIMDEQQAQELMKRAFLHPSTGSLSKEEIQKQIEAVRGLIKSHKAFFENTKQKLITLDTEAALESHVEAMNTMSDSLVVLTETLKPHLNGEKLEV